MTEKKQKNPFLGDGADFEDLSPVAREYLGMAGRMLYHSKSKAKPTTIFNANIFDSRAKKIWFGDLEIERDRVALLKISNELGHLYILYEMAGRFLDFVPSKRYVEVKAVVIVAHGDIFYSNEFAERALIFTMRARKPKKPMPELVHVKSGEIAVGQEKDMMHYEICHSPGAGRYGRDYVAVTPSCMGGFAFGKTAENALTALKRLYTICKSKEAADKETK
ncbi:MAG: hypothetical protein M0Z52_12305 [Actinomycetota bacterium]|nr:hypothetical protein [Nitrospiraceae bacterium]MDA8157211.1 hypothetical protein [Actinomycetota bacterium]